MTIQHGSRNPTGGTYLWRFASGQPMDGVRRTNHTFMRRATRDLTDHGRSSRWSHRAGWERSAYRISASAVTIAIIYGYFTAQTATVNSVLGALAALTAYGMMRARFAFVSARHHRRVVRPLWETLAMIMDGSTVHSRAYGSDHKRYLTIPRNYRDSKARISLNVSPTWEGTPGEIRRMTALITRRLGGDWDAIPRLSAIPPVIDFIPSPAPPASLTFAELRTILDNGKPSQIIIGMGTHETVITIDLDSESPHVALSMGTGGGKSSLLRLIVSYLIHHGVERVDIIDPKRISHDWAKGIPGVYIHRTMTEQMQAVAEFRKRMEARYEDLERDANTEFSRHVLVIEEQNSWMDYAKTYWDDYRAELTPAERGRTPRRNPAIGDLAYCLFQGRQARMNIFSVFQSMSASAAGGRDMRENYGAKILARYSPQTWKMLVGTTPVPRSSRIPGRGRFALGEDDREVQFAYMRERKAKDWPGVPESEWKDEAREYALAGTALAEVIRLPGQRTGRIPRSDAADSRMIEPATEPLALDPVPADEPAMSLRELCDAGMLPMTYSAAKRARTRAGDTFPPGKPSPAGATLYEPRDVLAWHESRSGGAGSARRSG